MVGISIYVASLFEGLNKPAATENNHLAKLALAAKIVDKLCTAVRICIWVAEKGFEKRMHHGHGHSKIPQFSCGVKDFSLYHGR